MGYINQFSVQRYEKKLKYANLNNFFKEKRVRACVYEKLFVSLHAILDKYAHDSDSHSACRAGDSAAERGGDLAERQQFSVAAYPSKRADETG